MAKRPKVKVLRKGSVAILKSDSVRADLQRRASAIAAAAGPGFVATVKYGRDRNLANVHAETDEARRAEAEDRALTRALDAGR